jgi:hypothetical protein
MGRVRELLPGRREEGEEAEGRAEVKQVRAELCVEDNRGECR